MKYNLNEIKHSLYSGILCDVLDGLGYRNQAISNAIAGLTEDTVIFGPAFTSIGTQVYSMPENPLIAQTRVVDQLGEGEIYVLVTRGEYNCAVFGELFATAINQRKGAGVLLDAYARDIKQLKAMIEQMRSEGKTLLVSTHIIDSVDMLWDRAIIMQNGRICANMTREELEQDGRTLEKLFFDVTEGLERDNMGG